MRSRPTHPLSPCGSRPTRAESFLSATRASAYCPCAEKLRAGKKKSGKKNAPLVVFPVRPKRLKSIRSAQSQTTVLVGGPVSRDHRKSPSRSILLRAGSSRAPYAEHDKKEREERFSARPLFSALEGQKNKEAKKHTHQRVPSRHHAPPCGAGAKRRLPRVELWRPRGGVGAEDSEGYAGNSSNPGERQKTKPNPEAESHGGPGPGAAGPVAAGMRTLATRAAQQVAQQAACSPSAILRSVSG